MNVTTTRTLNRDDLAYGGERPQDQGQIVVQTWYAHEDGPVLHHVDRSDGEESWTLYGWADGEEFEPWNGTTANIGEGVEVRVK